LVKTYFYVCNVGADFDLLDEGESKVIINLVIDRLLAKKAEDEEFSFYYDSMIENRSDKAFRDIVEKLYKFATTQAEPEKWLASCLDKYDEVEARAELDAYYKRKKPPIKARIAELMQEAKAVKYDALVKNLSEIESKLEGFIEKVSQFRSPQKDDSFPDLNEARGKLLEEVNDYLKEIREDDGRPEAAVFMREAEIIRDFTAELYKEVRREKLSRSKLDYNDVEHLAYEIMLDEVAGGEIKEENKFVFVDEYQDVNPLQDALIKGATGEKGVTYVVGDVKQSIYAFRMSDPDVFLDKFNNYEKHGFIEPKRFRHNFRSKREILDFCNAVFLRAMTPSFGKVNYEDEALVSGKGETGGRVKVVVFQGDKKEKEQKTEVYSVKKEIESNTLSDTSEADAVVKEILSLLGKTYRSGDKVNFITPKDIAVLFRVSTSPSVKQIYNKLKASGIDVFLKSKVDFSTVKEIKPLISFLRVISNGYDEISLAAYLLSPLVGLDENQLYKAGGRDIDKAEDLTKKWSEREKTDRKSMTEKLTLYAEQNDDEIAKKIKTAFNDIEKYGSLAPSLSVSELLGELISEKQYFNILLASKNDRSSAELLAEYLDYLSNLKSAETVGEYLDFVDRGKQEAECSAPENALKIMSVHASKGLEFPFVFLINCEKQFNEMDLNSRFLFDRDFGLCVKRKKTREEEKKGSSCKTDENRLWKAQKIRKRRALKEEALRLLYVAMTRAQVGLYVYTKERDFVDPEDAKCFADWILPVADKFNLDGAVEEAKTIAGDQTPSGEKGGFTELRKEEIVRAITESVNYEYKHKSVALKGSVTGIAGEESRSAAEQVEDDDRVITSSKPTEAQKKIMELGTAYHKIMELIDFSADFSVEKERLGAYFTEGISEDAIKCAHQAVGELIKSEGFEPYREQSFVYSDEDGKLVQGIIDLMLVNYERGEVVRLDYKLTGAERLLKDEYVRQINYYANAVEDVLGFKAERLILYSFTGKIMQKVERKRKF